MGIAQANPGRDQSNRAPFPKKGDSRTRSCNSKRRWVLLWRHIGPYRYSVSGSSRPLNWRITNPRVQREHRSPGRTRGNHLPGGELDRDGSAGGSLPAALDGNGALVAKEGWPRDPVLSDCHAVLIDGAKLGHSGLSLLAQRLRISNVTRLTRSLRSRCGARPNW